MKVLFISIVVFLFLDANEYEKSLNIVIDNNSNLMWQDNEEVTQYLETFISSEVYCDTLVLNGYIDWRVPKINEMIKIIDVQEKNAINKSFKYVEKGIYTTSSSFLENNEYLLGIDFKTGMILKDKKVNENYIRCIRDMK